MEWKAMNLLIAFASIVAAAAPGLSPSCSSHLTCATCRSAAGCAWCELAAECVVDDRGACQVRVQVLNGDGISE